MLLYRAQSVPSGRRIRTPQGNDPATRAAGRWFTDEIEAAHRHLARIKGRAQIVCVELADDIAMSFQVATTPVTSCGLEPIHHSEAPLRDFVIPRFFAMQAEEVETVADEDTAQIVPVRFAMRGRVEIGRVQSMHGDTVLYAEPTGSRLLTAVCEQTGGSVSFDEDGAALMGAMLVQASASETRKAA